MEFRSPYIAFSAPSGAGKTTIVKRLADKYEQAVISVSATTRPKRPGEQEGSDYFFMSTDEFQQAIKEDRFLEYEQVHGHYYGTLRDTVDTFVHNGRIVLFDIDVNGAQAVKQQYPSALLIFIKPPSREELIRRLRERKSEDEAGIANRLKRLEYEYEQAEQFDFTVINDGLEEAVRTVEDLILTRS